VERGTIGTMEAASTFDDEAYLGFVEGMRIFAVTKLARAMRERSVRALASDNSGAGFAGNLSAVQNVLDPLPTVAVRNHIFRNVQEMAWRRAVLTRERDGERLREDLELADSAGPGTLTLDPDLKMPQYYDSMDVHIQPGSYHRYDLAGFVYHYGSNVFHLGENYGEKVQAAIAASIPAPPDGTVRRLLDIGCTLGRTTVPLADRFSGAEIHGIDLSAPALRYAHMRAARLGKNIHFSQQAAESLKFPRDHFDLVLAYILFHEVPVDVGRRIVDEVHRVLRPGGLFAVLDFATDRPPADTPNAMVDEYTRAFDARLNGEPYSYGFTRSNFNEYLSRVFRVTDIKDEPFAALRGARLRICEK
jgi:ubiquinone/menaquinone biosynthesis C-methylase UbiE